MVARSCVLLAMDGSSSNGTPAAAAPKDPRKSGSHSESPSECYSESHLKCHLENHMRKSCEYLPFGLDWMKKCENHHSNIFLLWGGSGALRVQHYGWLIDLKCM